MATASRLVNVNANRPLGPEEIWDRFIDALDRAGQAGSPAGVLVPTFATSALAGRRFGDLLRDDVKTLARIAGALGRRGETIVTIWEDMHRKTRCELTAARRTRRQLNAARKRRQ